MGLAHDELFINVNSVLMRMVPKNLFFYLLMLTLGLNMTGCNDVKKKGQNILSKAKDFGNKKVDKIFPSYDSDHIDTENNKQRFKDHLQMSVTSDVKNIYAYGDFMGIDYKVLIAFTCEDSTIMKIVQLKKMELTTNKDDGGLMFLDELKWWDKSQIELLKPYKVGKEYEYWQYLWYNPQTKQAFYEEFSL